MLISCCPQEMSGLSKRVVSLETAVQADSDEKQDGEGGSLGSLMQKVNSLEESAWDDHEAMDERVSKLEAALASVSRACPPFQLCRPAVAVGLVRCAASWLTSWLAADRAHFPLQPTRTPTQVKRRSLRSRTCRRQYRPIAIGSTNSVLLGIIYLARRCGVGLVVGP